MLQHEIRRHILTALPLLTLVCASVSCEKDNFATECPGERGQSVDFLWSSAPYAMPEAMVTYFYPAGQAAAHADSRIWRFEFPGRNGGAVAVPPADFDIVGYNADATGIRMEYLETLPTLRATLLPYPNAGTAQRFQAADLRQMPGELYAALDAGETMAPGTKAVLRPRPLTRQWSYVIRNVENPESALGFEVALRGMASWTRVSDAVSGGICSIYMGIPQIRSGGLRGGGLTFGDAGSKVLLMLAAHLRDGSVKLMAYDVTGQVEVAPDPWNVSLVIDGVPLPDIPDDTVGEGGIQAGVEDWKQVDIQIKN